MVQTQKRSLVDLRLHPQRKFGLASLQCSAEKRRRSGVERAFRDRERNRVWVVVSPLHEEWEQMVVHRDVKPSNVLIESNMNPRLGDFEALRKRIDVGDNRTRRDDRVYGA